MYCCLQKGGAAAPPLPPSGSATGYYKQSHLKSQMLSRRSLTKVLATFPWPRKVSSPCLCVVGRRSLLVTGTWWAGCVVGNGRICLEELPAHISPHQPVSVHSRLHSCTPPVVEPHVDLLCSFVCINWFHRYVHIIFVQLMFFSVHTRQHNHVLYNIKCLLYIYFSVCLLHSQTGH